MDLTLEQEFAFHHHVAPYFEGWYSKTVTADVSLAVIFGISKTKKETYAFIQTNDTITGSYYERFEWHQCQITPSETIIKLGDNTLSYDHLFLRLKNGFTCDLTFTHHIPLQRTTYQPTIMGPFAYVKHMECIHAILSLQHQTNGTIMINQTMYSGEGIGYMEKDRGVSFPSSYTWFQSNHCEEEAASLFLSIAKIPFCHLTFTGCICVLMVKGKQLRFATYLGCRGHVVDGKNIVVIKQYPYKLLIKFLPHRANELLAPDMGEMSFRIRESLTSDAILHVYQHQDLVGVYHFHQGGYEHHLKSSKRTEIVEDTMAI